MLLSVDFFIEKQQYLRGMYSFVKLYKLSMQEYQSIYYNKTVNVVLIRHEFRELILKRKEIFEGG